MDDPTFWLSRDEVRELDRRAIEEFGVPGVVLMENAGRGCAELLMRLNPERKPTVILCGPGNNGGDGFVIARHLDNHGWPVRCASSSPKHDRDGRGDADVNFDILFDEPASRSRSTTRTTVERAASTDFVLAHDFEPAGWVVDALFGTGLVAPARAPFD